jgi:hypothetical protein
MKRIGICLLLCAVIMGWHMPVGATVADPVVAGVRLPASIAPFGQAMSLVGCGVRQRLWADLYVVSLYTGDTGPGPWVIGDPGLSQAVRLDIVYGGRMPDALPSDWLRRLEGTLTPDLVQAVESFYRGIQKGDAVVIAYDPQAGTLVTLNDQPIRQLPGWDLMQAMMNLWIGPNPVSADLKERLLRGGCS